MNWLLWVSIVVAVAACADTERTARCDAAEDDVVVTASLPDEPDAVNFRELWRIGGDDAGAHFGFPLPLALSRDGRAAIADFMLSEVFLVERDGTWRGSIARSGAGPGELASPVAVVWGDDGTLHVFDIMRPAIVQFAADLSYLGQDRVEPDAISPIIDSGELGWAGIQPSGALLLIPVQEVAKDDTGRERLLRYAAGSSVGDTLAATSFATVFAPNVRPARWPKGGSPRVVAATGAGGRFAAGTGEAYRVAVYANDGALVSRICVDAAPMPLRPDERGESNDTAFSGLRRALAEAEPTATPAAFGRIVVGADQTLWIQRERRSALPREGENIHGRPGALFDVFDARGVYRRTLRLPAHAQLQGASGDTIWAYEKGDLDEISLVTYAIERR